jgi:3(or 17)beta-hydroxysteroid dehydrogenase
MGRLEGKIALITGGISGLGAAAAIRFASEGAKLLLTDIRDTGASELLTRIRQAGSEAAFALHDVTDEAQWENIIARVLASFGGLDIVVNSAGVAGSGNIEEASYAEFLRINRVNYDGVFLGTKHGVRGIRQSGRKGSIINLSSIEGIIADPDLVAYNGSKGAVRLLTKSAALHCATRGYGIRVNSIHPGHIMTDMLIRHVNSQADPDATWAAIRARYPGGHLGEPDDIAYAALYLASDESKFMTGAELVVDGGFTAQ